MEINTGVVSSAGRVSRLHRLNPWLISTAKPYLIHLQPLIVTLCRKTDKV